MNFICTAEVGVLSTSEAFPFHVVRPLCIETEAKGFSIAWIEVMSGQVSDSFPGETSRRRLERRVQKVVICGEGGYGYKSSICRRGTGVA